ncbi:hypothetical protein M427DRAFT_62622 [Gonapodya prolifera JEL478]|uniref:Pentacotripeptide-repeat region of PRORP domain-containing protein n=1 Tax=Gonapodya prolifera (strain JEL478) TaxID=1344416 RepID=A0A139A0A0_GONPJ|nr:hypothetical protein M427DRAFT_62622 [Gonapodya prolifera JEL478]|eukprot:KXS10207.1 hypothetical protein M427DRAFT_62622 [Gonapodya prolifera JEL478]
MVASLTSWTEVDSIVQLCCRRPITGAERSLIRKEPHLFAQLKATEFRDLLCGGPEKPSESSPTDEIIADMRNHPTVRPSVIEYNLLASSHVEDWTVGDALGFLGTMRSEGVGPDEKTYEHLVKAVIGRKDIEGVERLVVDEMNRDGVKGNVTIYGLLAEAYVESRRRDTADNILNEIGKS